MKLSERELEVLEHSAKGYSAKEIARLMGLQPSTIQSYIISIRKKLQAKNMVHAVSIAYEKALIKGD